MINCLNLPLVLSYHFSFYAMQMLYILLEFGSLLFICARSERCLLKKNIIGLVIDSLVQIHTHSASYIASNSILFAFIFSFIRNRLKRKSSNRQGTYRHIYHRRHYVELQSFFQKGNIKKEKKNRIIIKLLRVGLRHKQHSIGL